MTCPDPECHKRLDGIVSTLYGSDGTGGVVGCLKEKVPKKWIWIIIFAFGLPILVFEANLWHKSNSRSLQFATLAMSRDHETRIRIVEDRYLELRRAINYNTEIQREMQKDIKKLLIRSRIGDE